MAAHIIAASAGPGARRADSKATPEQLRSFDNGIWMCYRHGKIVDTDEARFTIPMLRQWRIIAEKIQHARHARGEPLTSVADFDAETILAASHVTQIDYNLLPKSFHICVKDSYAAHVWGKDPADAARDFLIEVGLNSLRHGGASYVDLRVAGNGFSLTDDGGRFRPEDLCLDGGRGGAASLDHLRKKYGNQIIVQSEWLNDKNITRVFFAKSIADLEAMTDCFVYVGPHETSQSMEIRLRDKIKCNTVFAIYNEFATYSLAVSAIERVKLREKAVRHKHENRQIIFVTNSISSGLNQYLQSHLPGIQIMVLDADP